ncbi:MAG TPA: hypothetical protein VGP53_08920 [Acidimicrobiales bacterium]|nr:hypothetical protein [Acidimicrobiales bacterium]
MIGSHRSELAVGRTEQRDGGAVELDDEQLFHPEAGREGHLGVRFVARRTDLDDEHRATLHTPVSRLLGPEHHQIGHGHDFEPW